MEEIEKVIADYIREIGEIGDDPDFTPDVNLFDNGYLDSMGAIQVISFVEEKFQIKISEKDILKYNMNTVEEIAQVVKDKTGK